MTSKDIIIFVAVLAALGFSLYRKYVKKNQSTQGTCKISLEHLFPSQKMMIMNPIPKNRLSFIS